VESICLVQRRLPHTTQERIDCESRVFLGSARMTSTRTKHAMTTYATWSCHSAAVPPRPHEQIPKNERPVRGDNRTGQSHIGAWGGWALAPNIAMGRYFRSHNELVAGKEICVQNDQSFFDRPELRFARGTTRRSPDQRCLRRPVFQIALRV